MRLSRKQFSPFFFLIFLFQNTNWQHFSLRSPSGAVGVPAVLQRHCRLPGIRHLHLHHLRIPRPCGHMAQVLFFPPIYLNPSLPPTALSSALAVWLGKILKSGKLLKPGEGFASKSQNIRQLMRDGISFHRVFGTQLRGFGPKSGSKSREEPMAPALCGGSQMGFKILKKIF